MFLNFFITLYLFVIVFRLKYFKLKYKLKSLYKKNYVYFDK